MNKYLFSSVAAAVTLVVTIPAYSSYLDVRSSPSGCDILINGNPSGKTPHKIKLEKGLYRLQIRKDGYKIFTNEVELTGDLTEFARLSPENSHYTFIREVITGSQPKDLIYSPDGRFLMITTMDTPYIQLYDMKTSNLTNIYIPVYGKLRGFIEGVFNKDGSEYWFTQMNEHGRVFVLSMSNLTVITNIPTHADWTKVGEFTPDFKYYYVSNWLSDDVSIIDAAAYSYLGKFNTYGSQPRGIGFSNDGKFVYAIMFGSGEIIKYSIGNGYKVASRIKTGGANGRFRIDRVRELAYINNMGVQKLFVYDMKTDKIIRTLRMWDHPDNVKLSPDNRYLYVSNRGPNNKKGYMLRSPVNGKIQVFDTSSNYQKIEELAAGNQPIGLAITPDGKILAVSNFMDDTVDFYEIGL